MTALAIAVVCTPLIAWAILAAASLARTSARPWPGDALFGNDAAYFAGNEPPISPNAPRLLDDIAAVLGPQLVAEAELITKEAVQ